MGRLIYVEGIIGAGKTKYTEEISKRLNYRVIREPVEDNPYLELFYSDPKRYAYEMQIYLLHRRIGLQLLAAAEAEFSPDFAGAVLDRSLFGDRVFEELHYEAGNITEVQHHAYLTAVRNMKLQIFPPTTLVFLDVEPVVAMERVKERARGCETGIEMDYLERLTERYHKLIQAAQSGRYPWGHAVQVLVVPWNHSTRTEKEWDASAASLKRFQEEADGRADPEWRREATLQDRLNRQVDRKRSGSGNSPGDGAHSTVGVQAKGP